MASRVAASAAGRARVERFDAAAAKHGNPKAIVTFNPGVRVVCRTRAEVYTAGELNEPFGAIPASRWLEGSQWHALTFPGSVWSRCDTRYPAEKWAGWTRAVKAGLAQAPQRALIQTQSQPLKRDHESTVGRLEVSENDSGKSCGSERRWRAPAHRAGQPGRNLPSYPHRLLRATQAWPAFFRARRGFKTSDS